MPFRSKTPLYISSYNPRNTIFLHLISQMTGDKKNLPGKTKNLFWIFLKSSVTSSSTGYIPNSRLREMSLALLLMGMSLVGAGRWLQLYLHQSLDF